MSDIKIEDSIDAQSGSLTNRLQVTLSDTTSYVFYKHGVPANLSWRKTVDGGDNWNTQTYIEGMRGSMDIWYGKWRDSSGPSTVYLAWASSSAAEVRFARFDVATETTSTPVTVAATHALDDFVGQISITRARNGDLYVTGRSAFRSGGGMWRSTDNGVNWSSVADMTEAQDDQILMFPDYSSADTADICALFWDYSAQQVSIKQYDQSANTISETAIVSSVEGYKQTNAINQADRHNWSASLNSSGHIYLVVGNVMIGAGDPGPATFTTYDVFGSSVTAKTSVLSGIDWASSPALAIDAAGTVTVAYARSLTSDELSQAIFYKQSTDSMATWSTETQISSNDSYRVLIGIADILPVGIILPIWLRGAPGQDLYSVDNPIPVTTYTPTATPPLVFECKEVDGVYAVSVVVDGTAVVKCKVVDGVSVLSATVDAFTLPRSFT